MKKNSETHIMGYDKDDVRRIGYTLFHTEKVDQENIISNDGLMLKNSNGGYSMVPAKQLFKMWKMVKIEDKLKDA